MMFVEPVPEDSALAIENVKDEARNRGVAIVEGENIQFKFGGSDDQGENIRKRARVHFALIDILTEFEMNKKLEMWAKDKIGHKETSVQLAPKWALRNLHRI
jgi:hypothetical protein